MRLITLSILTFGKAHDSKKKLLSLEECMILLKLVKNQINLCTQLLQCIWALLSVLTDWAWYERALTQAIQPKAALKSAEQLRTRSCKSHSNLGERRRKLNLSSRISAAS